VKAHKVSRRDFLRLSGTVAAGTLLSGLGCGLSGTAPAATLGQGPTPASATKQSSPPLYLTVIVHSEEDVSNGTRPKANIPDYDGDEALMHHFGAAMREFGRVVQEHGARINFGSDWTFSRGVARYDSTFYTDLQAMGHEVDAHAHESFVMYRDVREEIVKAGGDPTHVASGLNEEEIQDRMSYFDIFHPEFQILWGVSLPGHPAGECTAPWVWRPSRTNWIEHDAEGKYIYIGHGELVNSLDEIQKAADGRSPDRVNTYAVFAAPRGFKAAAGTEGIAEAWTAKPEAHDFWENRIDWWDALLTQVDVLVERGDVRYASLTDIAGVFAQLESRLDFDLGAPPRSDAPLLRRSIEAGYEP
jgi:hypothetical protein